MCAETTYIALKRPLALPATPFWTVKSQFYADFGPTSRPTAHSLQFQTTTDLGVAFAPEIMVGCMTCLKGENLVSGGAAVP